MSGAIMPEFRLGQRGGACARIRPSSA